MNVHISYKLRKTPDLEKEINHLVEKLRKRLQVFRPELLHLKGVVEQSSPREGTTVSLNLRLPSGQLAAQRSARTPVAAIKSAFDDLLQQITRHKDLLRSSHKWTRRRSISSRDRGPGPFRANPGRGATIHHFSRGHSFLRERESLAPGTFRRARALFS